MAAVDKYGGLKHHTSVNDLSVYQNAEPVTPSDGTDLNNVSLALYVGGTGDLTVNMIGLGDPVTFKAVPVGTLLRVRVTRVLATGTTATGIVALW